MYLTAEIVSTALFANATALPLSLPTCNVLRGQNVRKHLSRLLCSISCITRCCRAVCFEDSTVLAASVLSVQRLRSCPAGLVTHMGGMRGIDMKNTLLMGPST